MEKNSSMFFFFPWCIILYFTYVLHLNLRTCPSCTKCMFRIYTLSSFVTGITLSHLDINYITIMLEIMWLRLLVAMAAIISLHMYCMSSNWFKLHCNTSCLVKSYPVNELWLLYNWLLDWFSNTSWLYPKIDTVRRGCFKVCQFGRLLGLII